MDPFYFSDSSSPHGLPSSSDNPQFTPTLTSSGRSSSRATFSILTPASMSMQMDNSPGTGFVKQSAATLESQMHASLVSQILALKREADNRHNLVERLENALETESAEKLALQDELKAKGKELRNVTRKLQSVEEATLIAIEDLCKERDAANEDCSKLKQRSDQHQRRVRALEEQQKNAQQSWSAEKETWQSERKALEVRAAVAETRLQGVLDDLANAQMQEFLLEQTGSNDAGGDSPVHDGAYVSCLTSPVREWNPERDSIDFRASIASLNPQNFSLADELNLPSEDEASEVDPFELTPKSARLERARQIKFSGLGGERPVLSTRHSLQVFPDAGRPLLRRADTDETVFVDFNDRDRLQERQVKASELRKSLSVLEAKSMRRRGHGSAYADISSQNRPQSVPVPSSAAHAWLINDLLKRSASSISNNSKLPLNEDASCSTSEHEEIDDTANNLPTLAEDDDGEELARSFGSSVKVYGRYERHVSYQDVGCQTVTSPEIMTTSVGLQTDLGTEEQFARTAPSFMSAASQLVNGKNDQPPSTDATTQKGSSLRPRASARGLRIDVKSSESLRSVDLDTTTSLHPDSAEQSEPTIANESHWARLRKSLLTNNKSASTIDTPVVQSSTEDVFDTATPSRAILAQQRALRSGFVPPTPVLEETGDGSVVRHSVPVRTLSTVNENRSTITRPATLTKSYTFGAGVVKAPFDVAGATTNIQHERKFSAQGPTLTKRNRSLSSLIGPSGRSSFSFAYRNSDVTHTPKRHSAASSPRPHSAINGPTRKVLRRVRSAASIGQEGIAEYSIIPVDLAESRGTAEETSILAQHRRDASYSSSFATAAQGLKAITTAIAAPAAAGAMVQHSVIDAISTAMVGEWMWKHTRGRRAFTGFRSTQRGLFEKGRANMQPRWVWLSPYDGTILWSSKQPTSEAELLGKGSRKLLVQSVIDIPNTTGIPRPSTSASNKQTSANMPCHSHSILILTPDQALKFTVTSASRHYIWLTALSYVSNTNATNSSAVSLVPVVPAQRNTPATVEELPMTSEQHNARNRGSSFKQSIMPNPRLPWNLFQRRSAKQQGDYGLTSQQTHSTIAISTTDPDEHIEVPAAEPPLREGQGSTASCNGSVPQPRFNLPRFPSIASFTQKDTSITSGPEPTKVSRANSMPARVTNLWTTSGISASEHMEPVPSVVPLPTLPRVPEKQRAKLQKRQSSSFKHKVAKGSVRRDPAPAVPRALFINDRIPMAERSANNARRPISATSFTSISLRTPSKRHIGPAAALATAEKSPTRSPPKSPTRRWSFNRNFPNFSRVTISTAQADDLTADSSAFASTTSSPVRLRHDVRSPLLPWMTTAALTTQRPPSRAPPSPPKGMSIIEADTATPTRGMTAMIDAELAEMDAFRRERDDVFPVRASSLRAANLHMMSTPVKQGKYRQDGVRQVSDVIEHDEEEEEDDKKGNINVFADDDGYDGTDGGLVPSIALNPTSVNSKGRRASMGEIDQRWI